MPRAQKNISTRLALAGSTPRWFCRAGYFFKLWSSLRLTSLSSLNTNSSNPATTTSVPRIPWSGSSIEIFELWKMIIPVRCFSCGKVWAHFTTSCALTNLALGYWRSLGEISRTHRSGHCWWVSFDKRSQTYVTITKACIQRCYGPTWMQEILLSAHDHDPRRPYWEAP